MVKRLSGYALLPEIAIFFGVTIDDIFSIHNADHLARIDKMLRDDYQITPENFAYASKVLTQAISDHPKDIDAYARLADLHQARANRDTLAAARLVEKAIEISPFNEGLHMTLIRTRKSRFEYDRVTRFYQKHIRLYPTWINGYLYLADIFLTNRQIPEAKATIHEGLAKKPNSHLKFMLGDVFFLENDKQTGNHDRAFSLWERAYAKFPESASPLYSAAFLYDHIGQYQKAIEKWEDIVAHIKTHQEINNGELIDWPMREIDRLKQKLAGKHTSY